MTENEGRRAAAVEAASRAARLDALAAEADGSALGQALAAAAADAGALRDALLLLVLADERDTLAYLGTEAFQAALTELERERDDKIGGLRAAKESHPEWPVAEIAVCEARIGGARYLLAERGAGAPPVPPTIGIPSGVVARPTSAGVRWDAAPALPNRGVPTPASSGLAPPPAPAPAPAVDRLGWHLRMGLPQALSVALVGIALMILLALAAG